MEEKIYYNNIQKHQGKETGKKACDNALGFFEKNEFLCVNSYEYYKEYKDKRSNYVSEPIPSKNIGDVAEKVHLLITVNEIEEGILLHYLSEVNAAPLKSYLIGGSVYHLCTKAINGETYFLVHTRSQRTGDEFMRRTINAAVSNLGIEKIEYIYMLGICYGIDFNSQKLGDVIVSNHVLGYRVNFRDDSSEDEIEVEPEEEFNETPNEKYIKEFSNFLCYFDIENFNFGMPKFKVKIHFGKYLSANCLMSSKKAKDSILKKIGNAKPKAMAGEMEACGIFKSILCSGANNFKNWLVVKSICDWGENKNLFPENPERNDFIKNCLQAYAMVNTCNAFNMMLSKKFLYKEDI